jgi:hypothetical protein
MNDLYLIRRKEWVVARVCGPMQAFADRGGTETREQPARLRTDSRGLSPAALLTLQQQAGNRATRRLARQVDIRGVPWEPESGLSRLPELIDRMNAISPSLAFSMDGPALRYEQRTDPQPPNNFDLQMMDLIDRDVLVPVRLVNRQARLGTAPTGFHTAVDGDAFQSGYVDVDDLLAGDDLGFQMLLLHFLTERAVTRPPPRQVQTPDQARTRTRGGRQRLIGRRRHPPGPDPYSRGLPGAARTRGRPRGHRALSRRDDL